MVVIDHTYMEDFIQFRPLNFTPMTISYTNGNWS